MENLTSENIFEIGFENNYLPLTSREVFTLFLVEYRRILKGLLRYQYIVFILFIAWVLTQNPVIFWAFILTLPLELFGLVSLLPTWLEFKKSHKEHSLTYKSYIEKRSLKFGDFGIILTETGRNGNFEDKFGWVRFKKAIEFNDWLILLPVNRKIALFVIRKIELGDNGYKSFKEFAIEKLPFQLLTNRIQLF